MPGNALSVQQRAFREREKGLEASVLSLQAEKMKLDKIIRKLKAIENASQAKQQG